MRQATAVGVFLFFVGGVAIAEEKKPFDAKCGTPEWRPFLHAVEAHAKAKTRKGKVPYELEVTVELFKQCKHERIAGEATPIPAKDIVKGKFDYEIEYDAGSGSTSYRLSFVKPKKGWVLKRLSVSSDQG